MEFRSVHRRFLFFTSANGATILLWSMTVWSGSCGSAHTCRMASLAAVTWCRAQAAYLFVVLFLLVPQRLWWWHRRHRLWAKRANLVCPALRFHARRCWWQRLPKHGVQRHRNRGWGDSKAHHLFLHVITMVVVDQRAIRQLVVPVQVLADLAAWNVVELAQVHMRNPLNPCKAILVIDRLSWLWRRWRRRLAGVGRHPRRQFRRQRARAVAILVEIIVCVPLPLSQRCQHCPHSALRASCHIVGW